MRRIFAWVVKHPRTTIGMMVAITIGFATFIPQIETDTDFSNYIDRNNPTIQAVERAEERYGDQIPLLVAVENEDGIFNTETLTKIYRAQERIESLGGLSEVTGPLNAQTITGTATTIKVAPAAPDGEVPMSAEDLAAYRERVMSSRMVRDYIVSSDEQAATISIKFETTAERIPVTKEILRVLEEEITPPERFYVAGLSYMNVVLTGSMLDDLWILLPLVILAIVVVLYGTFRSFRGVLIPLLVVSLSVVWTVGMMAISHVSITVISFILPVILMAIGIAYGIHVLNYYEEATKSGMDRRTAAVETGVHMFSPVFMTGLTTGAGFLSLMSSLLIPQREFGLFATVGVLAAMLLSLFLIPALLVLLPVPRRRSRKTGRDILGPAFAFFERLVLRHRRKVIVVGAFVFVGFVAGLPFLEIETSQREFLGDRSEVVQGMTAMGRHFSGSEQLMIEIDTGKEGGLKDPEMLRKMVDLETFLEKEGVKKTLALSDIVREMNQKYHADDPAYFVLPENRQAISQLLFFFTGNLGNMALIDYSAGEVMGLYPMASSAEQARLVKEVEQYLDEHFDETVRVEMVGATRTQVSLYSRIATSQLKSLGTSILAAGAIVSLLMLSLSAGLISVIPLVLTVAVNFGVMAYSGTPLNLATLMVSSIAIGIGIDYAIHFVSRFRSENLARKQLDQALGVTLRTTGRGIAANALALALGFIVLVLSSFKGTRQFGLLISMTMVLSAMSAFTIIPAVLLTWTPGFIRRERHAGRKDKAILEEK